MRYEIGQKVPFIHFTIDGKDFDSSINHLMFITPIPWSMTIKDVHVKVMECIEHHKVSWNQEPNGEKKYDGFVFNDQQGHLWHNQYPYASYGQLSDVSDGRITIHPNEGETYAHLDSANTIMEMQDLARYLSELLSAIHDLSEIQPDKSQMLQQVYAKVVEVVRSSGLNVLYSLLLFKGKEVEGCYEVSFEEINCAN